jgi:signal transduction histidine kinase
VRALWRSVLVLAVAAALVRPAAAEPLPRAVLIFDQSEPNSPWGLEFRAALVSALRAGSATPLVIYSETLDLGRFNSPQYVQLLQAYVQEKYRGKPIGVIVAQGAAALEILLHMRGELWPSVPVVFGSVDAPTLPRLLPPDVTGTTYRMTLGNAVVAARALVPNLKRMVLVGTPFERDPWRRHFAQELASFTHELELIDLLGQPMDEVRRRVATLPDDAAIYYTVSYGAGNTRDVVPLLAQAANRPIVSDTVTQIGHGSTGGIVVVPEPIAAEAARRALRILDGEPASRMPVTRGHFTKPVFDWRQLQRWKVSEARLPPGSEIRFRPPSMWEQYRWQVIAALAVVLFQAAMITWLLLERYRRRAAELESRGRLLQVIHLNRTAATGVLSASIAHELNQPLGAILSNAEAAELLLDAKPPDLDEVREILADIRQSDRRAVEIIAHLRGLLKKKTELELSELDLNDAVADAVHVLEPEAMKQRVALSVDPAPAPVTVRADPVHLQQVILNLAMNGMDAMASRPPGERRLAVQTALNGASEVEVSITDSGSGIPKDKLIEVFETFYTTKQQGTGLGLTIARTIVETYGGKIWAENRIAGGAVFRFSLPLSRARLAHVEARL